MSETNGPTAEALAEQIGAVEETIAELRVDPLLYHEQAGPVIDLRIARLTAVIATLKERDADEAVAREREEIAALVWTWEGHRYDLVAVIRARGAAARPAEPPRKP